MSYANKPPKRFKYDNTACKVFSDRFSEGQARNINDGFPSDSLPHTEDYDYLSDSDLEDESFCSGEDETNAPQIPPTTTSKNPPQLPQRKIEVKRNHVSAPNSVELYDLFG